METRWDILLELSREPFELEQICQWLKCAPLWEEQSFNSVFHCKSAGSPTIRTTTIRSTTIRSRQFVPPTIRTTTIRTTTIRTTTFRT